MSNSQPGTLACLGVRLGKLAAWADRRLIPAVLCSILAVDILVGLNWFLSPPENLSSPAYDTGKKLMSLDGWGLLLISLACAAIAAFAAGGRRWFSGYIVGGLIAAVWGFWVVMFVLGPLGRPGASFALAGLSIGMTLIHMLTGLASTHHASGPDLVHERARLIAQAQRDCARAQAGR